MIYQREMMVLISCHHMLKWMKQNKQKIYINKVAVCVFVWKIFLYNNLGTTSKK